MRGSNARTKSGSSKRSATPFKVSDTLSGRHPMVFLGFGKYIRADRIFGIEPLPGDERGSGARTRVWVEGIPEAVIASRSERAILADMGVLPPRSRPAPQDENLF